MLVRSNKFHLSLVAFGVPLVLRLICLQVVCKLKGNVFIKNSTTFRWLEGENEFEAKVALLKENYDLNVFNDYSKSKLSEQFLPCM